MLERIGLGLGGVAIAASAAAAAGVVFFVALLTGWWFLGGALAALVVLVPGALVVGAVGASGRPTDPVARVLTRAMVLAFVVFTIAGTVLRYG